MKHNSKLFAIVMVFALTLVMSAPAVEGYGGETLTYDGGIRFAGCADILIDPAHATQIPLTLSGLDTSQPYTFEVTLQSFERGERYQYISHTQQPGRSTFTFWVGTFANQTPLPDDLATLGVVVSLLSPETGLIAGMIGQLDCQTGDFQGMLLH